MAKKLINLAKIDFAGESGSAPVPPGPGPTPTPSADADVVLRDYDGTIIASYTAEEFAALTELPTPPEHEGLTFQEWNWPLADAQAYCAQYGMVDIGATYITSDGKTRIYITLPEGRTSPVLGLNLIGTADVDWGDGSIHDTLSGSSLSTVKTISHDYASAGDYVIAITPEVNTRMSIVGNSNYGTNLLTALTNTVFVYCNCINKVELGDGITTLGVYAFGNCNRLESITFTNKITTIGNYSFFNCRSLKGVSFPHAIRTFGTNIFLNCFSLGYVSLSNSFTVLETSFFNYCYSLTRIAIPSTVTTLGAGVFNACVNLQKVIIPSSVTTTSGNLFTGCSCLKSIIFYKVSVPSYGCQDCVSLQKVTLAPGSTSVDYYAFRGCYNLREIIIPDSVVTIRQQAFYQCYNLRSVDLSNGVTSIESSAFEYNSLLLSLNIPDSVTTIGSSAFADCSSLVSVTIGSGVTQIGVTAFRRCYSIKEFIVKPITPPTMAASALQGIQADCIIYVPAESVETYKAASGWSTYASQIQPMP
jgi:hypothetical protein